MEPLSNFLKNVPQVIGDGLSEAFGPEIAEYVSGDKAWVGWGILIGIFFVATVLLKGRR